jgi:hypothetical protein
VTKRVVEQVNLPLGVPDSLTRTSPSLCGLVAISLCFQSGDLEQTRVGAFSKRRRRLGALIQATELAIGSVFDRCSLGNVRCPVVTVAGAPASCQRSKHDRNKRPR